jgi:hypothetical protein
MMLYDETGLFSAVYSRYYHGPFRCWKREVEALVHFFESQEKRQPAKIYTCVADCPRCWTERAGPTTVLFARV